MLDRVLREHLGDASWNQVRSWILQGKVSVDGETVLLPTSLVIAGSRLEFRPTRSRARAPSDRPFSILHQDSQVIVVDKASGVATVPFEDSEQNSLDRLLAAHLGQKGRPARVFVVHRLDKETSGVLIFARTAAALGHLKSQFRFHTTHRRYVALVHGTAPSGTIVSRLVTNRGDGRRGSTTNPWLGREAITHVRVLETFEGASLIECRLETGRTHQIRIHLAESGHPLLGERVYSKGVTLAPLPAPRLLLHARELGFDHPSTGQPLRFESPLPADFEAALLSLREKGSKQT